MSNTTLLAPLLADPNVARESAASVLKDTKDVPAASVESDVRQEKDQGDNAEVVLEISTSPSDELAGLWDAVSETLPPRGHKWYWDGREVVDSNPAFKAAAKRYGEFCQLTYSMYRPVKPTEEEKQLEAQKLQHTKTSRKTVINRTVALPKEQLLCPHPLYGEDFSERNGYLEPDSLILKGGYKTAKYLYAASGILQGARSVGRSGFTKWIGYVAYSQQLQEVVVVFRGTQDPDEWAQNADFNAVPVVDRIDGYDENVRAHNGFMECYYESVSKLMDQPLSAQVVDAILKVIDIGKGEGWAPRVLTITGHSLGGALATVCAFDLIHSQQLLEAWPGLPDAIQGITYAQPSVGNEFYKKVFEAKIPERKWIRLVNKGDIVPQVPYATISWISRLADNFFSKRLFADQPSADRRKMPAGVVIDQAHAAGRKARKESADIFVHVGWELRFFPDNYHYLNMQRFQGVAKYIAYIPTMIVRGLWHVFYKPALALLAFQWVSRLDHMPEPIIFEKPAQRHCLEVYIHLIDPTGDKARLNRSDNILLPQKLSEEERKLLGAVCGSWWNPWPLTDPTKPLMHNGLGMTFDETAQVHRWAFKANPASH